MADSAECDQFFKMLGSIHQITMLGSIHQIDWQSYTLNFLELKPFFFLDKGKLINVGIITCRERWSEDDQ